MANRRGSLHETRGKERLGYVYASPLCDMDGNGRKQEMELLDTAQELKMIREKLGRSERQIRFRAAVATPTNLRELLDKGCRMLHYTGHGNNEMLAFESDNGRQCGIMKPLEVNKLKNLFQAGGVSTELVFISSCSSELSGNAFVEAGVPHVVAVKVQERVTDQAAQAFGASFYHALIIGGYTVQHAFDIALNLVNASGRDAIPQGDNFLLLPEGGDHDVEIFDTLPEGEFMDETRPLPPMVRLPGAKSLYLGTVALQKVVEMLVEPSTACVTVTGEPGSGKTEMALQACAYVRERHRFDAIFFVDCKKASASANASANGASSPPASGGGGSCIEDPCRLIGANLCMNTEPESPEELAHFLFTHPIESESQELHKVLLVLDSADALFDGKGCQARDRLVELLNNMCCARRHLRLLLTSERRLLRETNFRFRNGTEKVTKVAPLGNRESAQLLTDLMPRKLRYTELGIQSGSSHTAIMSALGQHSVIEKAEGHPGTLARLAPLLFDHNLTDPYITEMAATYRKQFRSDSTPSTRRHSISGSNGKVEGAGGGLRQSFSFDFGAMHSPGPGPNTHSRLPPVSSDGHLLHQPGSRVGGGGHFLLNGGGAANSLNGGDKHLPQMILSQQDPEAPQMTPAEKLAWDTAAETGLRDRGCRLVWVEATANAAAERSERGQGAPGGGEAGRPDSVPWKNLSKSLEHYLCGMLTLPSTQGQVVDEGPLGWRESAGYTGGGHGQMGGYGSMNSVSPRGMNHAELRFVEGVLRSKQDALRRDKYRRRFNGFGGGSGGAMEYSGRAELWDRGIRVGRGAIGGGGRDERVSGGDDEDIIFLEAYVRFCDWWAPLMITLSRLRNDWASTTPVRVEGFVGRLEAERKLLMRERGTFLLRFSESRPGALVVSFSENVRLAPSGSSYHATPAHRASLCVQHCLVTVQQGGRCKIDVDDNLTGTDAVSYAGLHDLVRDCSKLQTLYPNVPKGMVFSETSDAFGHRAAQSTINTNASRVRMGDDAELSWEVGHSGASRFTGGDHSCGENGIVRRSPEPDLLFSAGE